MCLLKKYSCSAGTYVCGSSSYKTSIACLDCKLVSCIVLVLERDKYNSGGLNWSCNA